MVAIHSSLSVVVLTCNRPQDLELSVRSILAQDIYPSEIVLVDDGDLDPTDLRELIEGSGVKLTYHRKARRGIAGSRNIGAHLSSGDLIMYLDDDERMEPGYIRTFIELFENDDQETIVGATAARVGGSGDEPGRLDPLWDGLERFFLLRGPGHQIMSSGYSSADYTSFSEPTDVDFLSGTATYRRRVFDSFRFDEELERFSPYALGEDLAFSFKIRGLGRRIVTPHAKLAHHRSQQSRPASSERARLGMYNHYYIYRRYLRDHLAHPLAFLWATFGEVVISALRFAIRPSRQTWEVLKGTVSGSFLVARTALGRKPWQSSEEESLG